MWSSWRAGRRRVLGRDAARGSDGPGAPAMVRRGPCYLAIFARTLQHHRTPSIASAKNRRNRTIRAKPDQLPPEVAMAGLGSAWPLRIIARAPTEPLRSV